jgi:hypothetical protein
MILVSAIPGSFAPFRYPRQADHEYQSCHDNGQKRIDKCVSDHLQTSLQVGSDYDYNTRF